MKPLVLVIDDDISYTSDLKILLKSDFNCISADNVDEGIKLLKEEIPDLILLDLMFKNGKDGFSAIEQIKAFDNNLPIIMITDYASVETAINAIKLGAFDYISKTTKVAELKLVIEKALENKISEIRREVLKNDYEKHFNNIVGESNVIQKMKEQISLFANNDNTLLIKGESGVGKELVTRQIHSLSPRKNAPFIAVNCAAIPKELLISELFGHEKGSFTGANNKRIGRFELAADGTLFLDEISELDFDAQVILLRVLQEKEFERVGSSDVIKTNARVIAATNKNLEELVSQGLFREDLFYRLDVLRIDVPPLKARKEDIPLLVNHFVKETYEDTKIPFKKFSAHSIELLKNYDWPGNIRELKNFITRAIILSQGFEEIQIADNDKFRLTDSLFEKGSIESWEEMIEVRKEASAKAARDVEEHFVKSLLQKYDGNISLAASDMKIDRTTLYKVIKRCNLDIS